MKKLLVGAFLAASIAFAGFVTDTSAAEMKYDMSCEKAADKKAAINRGFSPSQADALVLSFSLVLR